MTECVRDVDMQLLAGLAGWRSQLDRRDTVVVRLALRTAYDRTDPNAGGRRADHLLVADIEARWLEDLR